MPVLVAAGFEPTRKAVRPASGDPVAFILNEDPDLAQGLSDQDRRAAYELLCAPVAHVDSGPWDPPHCELRNGFGLLVLDGLIGRRVRVASAVATELVTSGDIIRPWDTFLLSSSFSAEEQWRVFHPARLALLDERITTLIGRRPELLVAFSDRLIRRVRSTMYLMAVSHLPRVEERLLGTLWHLASTSGRVTPRGIKVPFRLSHENLGDLIGARRPSVTLAITRLRERKQLDRDQDGAYLLTGDPTDWNRRP